MRENPFSEETVDGQWRTVCPEGCRRDDGRPVGIRLLLHIPYDPELLNELNTPTYQLAKTGKVQYSHPQGTHDDRFWALILVVYAPEIEPSKSLPMI